MAITERQEISQRTVLVGGQIQVRTDTVIERDGIEIGRTYHRHVLSPGDDVSRKHESVQRIAKAEHTPAKIAAYKLSQENTA